MNRQYLEEVKFELEYQKNIILESCRNKRLDYYTPKEYRIDEMLGFTTPPKYIIPSREQADIDMYNELLAAVDKELGINEHKWIEVPIEEGRRSIGDFMDFIMDSPLRLFAFVYGVASIVTLILVVIF